MNNKRDYSNTIIYRLICNDSAVTYTYIGYTTNFSQKKHFHKQCCNNSKNIQYNSEMYQKIREHGGWNNWNFEIVKICNCINQYDAQIKTNEYKYSLQTNINPNIQINNPNINQINLDTNLVTNLHLQCETTEEINVIESLRFICQTCNYKTNKKSSYNAHILSNKHKKMVDFATDVSKYICKQCNKGFNDRAGLWRHNKKCIVTCTTPTTIYNETINTEPTPTPTTVCDDPTSTIDQTAHLTNLVMKVLEQNQELTKQIIELSKQTSVTNNTINNNNNNNFSINVFLNETCKDALNITDFVDSLVLSINDLEETGRLGYANGISKIFINGLKNLDIDKRPLHCSDIKRNTLYIKDDNQWIKETNETPLLTKAIKNVSNKNIQTIFEWQKLNPHYNDSDSKQNDKYNKIICEAMSGSCKEEQLKNYEKIVNKIAKEVVIEK